MNNNIISILLLALLLGVVVSQTPPVWDAQFEQTFTERMKYGFITSTTTGTYYYDAINNYTRLDRANGEYDRYCGSVHLFTNTPCTHLVRDNKRFLIFPELKSCCFCCTSANGCGIVRRDWLTNATFVGYETVQGVKVEKWDKHGLQSNFYANTVGTNTPAYIDMVPNDYMEFNIASYKNKISDPSVFDLPDICKDQQQCPLLSICTVASQRQVHNN